MAPAVGGVVGLVAPGSVTVPMRTVVTSSVALLKFAAPVPSVTVVPAVVGAYSNVEPVMVVPAPIVSASVCNETRSSPVEVRLTPGLVVTPFPAAVWMKMLPGACTLPTMPRLAASSSVKLPLVVTEKVESWPTVLVPVKTASETELPLSVPTLSVPVLSSMPPSEVNARLFASIVPVTVMPPLVVLSVAVPPVSSSVSATVSVCAFVSEKALLPEIVKPPSVPMVLAPVRLTVPSADPVNTLASMTPPVCEMTAFEIRSTVCEPPALSAVSLPASAMPPAPVSVLSVMLPALDVSVTPDGTVSAFPAPVTSRSRSFFVVMLPPSTSDAPVSMSDFNASPDPTLLPNVTVPAVALMVSAWPPALAASTVELKSIEPPVLTSVSSEASVAAPV